MTTKNIILAVLAAALVLFIVVMGGSKNIETPTPTETATTTQSATEQKQEVVETKGEVKAVTTAVITTNKGVITLELYSRESPKTVANFVKLANEGFYNGTRFHRVIKGFMIQGGDPLSKDMTRQAYWGTGGPESTIPDEFNANADLYKVGYKRGVIAMANTGRPNSGGSQFFIMHQDYALQPAYTIFGKVTTGIESVDKIASAETVMNAQGTEKSVPTEDLIVEKIEIK